MTNYKYDIALSFASEQRDYVEQVANHLSALGINAFYDKSQLTNLWGKNLIKYLEKVYYHDSRYCVMFISQEYKKKCWTKLESEAIEERIFSQSDGVDFQQYILPVRFDDTKIPGIKDCWGTVWAKDTSPQKLAQMIYEKLKDAEHSKDEIDQLNYLDDIYDELIKNFPEKYIVQNIKKSISNQNTDALLLFDNNGFFQNNFTLYDGKIFINGGEMYVLNLGFFNAPQILFEITLPELLTMFVNKVNESDSKYV